MNIEVNDKQVIPYSHHYRCFPQMVGSVVNQAVFMYLLDEYLCRLRTGKATEFVVSANEIAQKRNINWRTVVKSLNELQTMRLISLNDKVGTINVNRYISLIKAFSSLTKTTDKKEFIRLLQAGDYVNLHKLGYQEYSDGNEQLLMQEGVLQNYIGLCKNTEPYVKIQKSDLCKSAEPYVKIHNPLQKYITLCKNAEPYVKMQKVLQKYITILDEIRQEIQEAYTKSEFFDEFSEDFLDFLSEEEFGNLANTLFDEFDPENTILGAEFTFFLHHWGYVKVQKGLCKNTQGVLQKYTTVNNIEINKNKKEIRNNEVIPHKEKNKDSFLELDKEGLEHSLSGYQQAKRKSQLPFFPVNEVEEYISDIRNCLDRADKLFINQVWEIAHECFDREAILDEDGNEQLPADNEIENVGVAKERLMKDILLPAFDKIQELVEAGVVSVNGEEYQITATIDNPDDFNNIIDWELQTLLDGENYIISKKRVRNIYAQAIERTSRTVSRDKREDDMTYMQKIVVLGDDDTRFDKLTPIELVIYNFLNEYFQIGDNGEIIEPKLPFVNRVGLANFYLDAQAKGVTSDDFLSVLSKDKPEYGTGSLNLRQRMFSADKIREWNSLHSVSSIVDKIEPYKE